MRFPAKSGKKYWAMPTQSAARPLIPSKNIFVGMSLLKSFVRHARNIGAMTAEEMDAVRAGVASGSGTESGAIEAWTGRVREGEWEYYKGVTWGPPTDKTRFKVGDKVYACMGEGAWVRAVVRKVWVCEEDWCE